LALLDFPSSLWWLEGWWCAEPIKISLIGAFSTPYGKREKVSPEISVEELNKEV